MQKILILGCCGAGKSTFARKLHAKIGLEIIHLDQHYWNANWQESEPTKWKKRVQELAAQPAWIMDGNYGSTLDMRIEKADTISIWTAQLIFVCGAFLSAHGIITGRRDLICLLVVRRGLILSSFIMWRSLIWCVVRHY